MIDYRRSNSVSYRADIDGLRAVAVVPVVLYHAGIAPFSGGFVGVDVFFVISGYLITSLIIRQIERGKFSLSDFYLRRIRRIFPALFLMMAICAVAGWILFSPHAYRRLGDSIFATVLFSSNVLFWLQSGYFSTPLEDRPLLHTWSLGVEEQFYVFFPIFVVLVYKFFPRRLIGLTFALGIASLALNILTVKSHPNFAFFLAPTRIWELFIGALLAMGALVPPRAGIWSDFAGFVGIALIGCAIFGFSKETPFPGFAALLPVIGAIAIIWAGTGGNGIVTRLLSHPIPVLIGKISYSLYLWHFPLLAFGAYIFVAGLSLTAQFALIALSTVLAFASWRYVEQPVRKGRWVFGKSRSVYGAAAAALVLFGGFGLAAHFAHGFPGRFDNRDLQILASETDINPDRGLCLRTDSGTEISRRPLCKLGLDDAAPEFVVWGDSHAESLRAAFDGAAKKGLRGGIFYGTAGCIPALGIDRNGSGCSRANAAILESFLSKPSIHIVVLSGRWALWAEGVPYKHEGGHPLIMTDASGARIDNHKGLAAALERTVAKLVAAGKQVWIVGPIPEIGYDVPRALYFNSLGISRSLDIRPTLKEFNDREGFVLKLIASITKKYQTRVIWPHRYLCDTGFCQVEKDDRALYIDDHHLTRFAAASMSVIFDPIFAQPQQSNRP